MTTRKAITRLGLLALIALLASGAWAQEGRGQGAGHGGKGKGKDKPELAHPAPPAQAVHPAHPAHPAHPTTVPPARPDHSGAPVLARPGDPPPAGAPGRPSRMDLIQAGSKKDARGAPVALRRPGAGAARGEGERLGVEERKHLKRMAQIERLEAVAQDAGKPHLADKARALRQKELERHRRALVQLRRGVAPPPRARDAARPDALKVRPAAAGAPGTPPRVLVPPPRPTAPAAPSPDTL